MTIVSSVIAEQQIQADGRHAVRESHTDQFGITYQRAYLAPADADLNAEMLAYAQSLDRQLAAAEIARNYAQVTENGSLAVVTFDYSTKDENIEALRSAYQSESYVHAVMIGDFVNSLTDTQISAVFGLMPDEVAQLRTNKLSLDAQAAATIRRG